MCIIGLLKGRGAIKWLIERGAMPMSLPAVPFRTPLGAMNNASRRFLHNHGNIATEESPKPGLCPTLISNDFKGSL